MKKYSTPITDHFIWERGSLGDQVVLERDWHRRCMLFFPYVNEISDYEFDKVDDYYALLLGFHKIIEGRLLITRYIRWIGLYWKMFTMENDGRIYVRLKEEA